MLFSIWTKSTFHQLFLIKVITGDILYSVNACYYTIRILNFILYCLGGNIIGEINPTTPTKKVFAIMISSKSKNGHKL